MDGDGGFKAKLTYDADWPQLEEVQRPFDEVSAQLALLGAISVDDFLSNAPTVPAAYDLSFTLQQPPEYPEQEANTAETLQEKANDAENAKETDKDKDEDGDKEGEPKAEESTGDSSIALRKATKNCVWQLRQASLNVLGSTECLDWGYVEGPMPAGKQCILTIKRPTGATRSYKSDTGFSRKQDARGQAAQIAIEMGAIDFIVSGDSDALKAKKGLLLNPLDVQLESVDSLEADPAPRWTLGEEPLKVIEECCQEWRGGKVKPHWIPYSDFKNSKKIGVAMRISLNTHVYRAYSVDPVHNSLRQAKVACSRAAIDQGVLDFIRYGNGQTEPMKVPVNDVEDIHDAEEDLPPPVILKGISLQEFYDSLPQPFPEDLGDKSATEFNAPAWLNIAIQSARGARLSIKFLPVVDGINRFHGSVLRLERPEEIRTYVVDPQFPKRSDAKSAVCLLAMSQGVGQYIRDLKESAENKVPADKRKLANGILLQLLAAECSKIRAGNKLVFSYPQDRDAFGCTLTADISSDPDAPNIKQFSVPTEFPNKTDAKAAVACLAAEKGLVDLFRFRGGPLPPDYVPFWEAQVNGEGDKYVPKRKEPERDVDGEGRDRKKRKKGNNGSDAPDAGLPAKPKTMLLPANLPAKPVTAPPPEIFSSNNRWKGPRASASRGLGSTNERASASRMVSQDRSGNRSGDIPYYPESHYPSSSAAPLASHDPYPRVHPHPREYDDVEDYRHEAGYRDAHTRYGPTDHYGNPYPVYSPPSGSGHYAVSGYRSPPPAMPPVTLPPSAPPPPNHYPGYYTGPSTPTSGSPHSPYAQYTYPPSSYHPHYPHVTSYGSYSHPPAVYPSPPPPLPPPPTRGRLSRQASTSRDSHSYPDAGYDRDINFAPSPVRPSTPPRRSHVSYPSHPVEFGFVDAPRPVRRRHSTVADVRTRDPHPTQSTDDHKNQYDGKKPPPPVAESTLVDNKRAEWDEQSREIPALRPEQPVALAKSSMTAVQTEKPRSPAPPPITTPTKGSTVNTKSNDPVSCLHALYDFCDQEKIDRPKFFHQYVAGTEPKKYIVWAEKDSHRLELPNQFSSMEEGYEKLSKRVLGWERSRLQK